MKRGEGKERTRNIQLFNQGILRTNTGSMSYVRTGTAGDGECGGGGGG